MAALSLTLALLTLLAGFAVPFIVPLAAIDLLTLQLGSLVIAALFFVAAYWLAD